jgi:hypothetical protein
MNSRFSPSRHLSVSGRQATEIVPSWAYSVLGEGRNSLPQRRHDAIIAVPFASLPASSSLVRRLTRARNDPGKERVRARLMALDDAQLSSGLGLTSGDIAVLRGGTPRRVS